MGSMGYKSYPATSGCKSENEKAKGASVASPFCHGGSSVPPCGFFHCKSDGGKINIPITKVTRKSVNVV